MKDRFLFGFRLYDIEDLEEFRDPWPDEPQEPIAPALNTAMDDGDGLPGKYRLEQTMPWRDRRAPGRNA